MKFYWIFTLFLLSGSLWSQDGSVLNTKNHALEFNFGYSQPLNYFGENSFGSNFGVNHYKLGYRYHFNKDLGIRASFTFNRYTADMASMNTSRMTMYKLEAVYNLGRSFGLLNSSAKNFTLLGYAGLGYGRHTNPGFNYVRPEAIMPVSLGLTPTFKVSEFISMFIDAEFINNFQQDIRFDGNFVDPEVTYEGNPSGLMMNFSIGIAIFMGTETTATPVDFR